MITAGQRQRKRIPGGNGVAGSSPAPATQLLLPIPGWPRQWFLNLVGWLLRLANSAGGRDVEGWEWFNIKAAALRRWGRREGWDGQVFQCYGQRSEWDGCGGRFPAVPCSEDCPRCDGTGIHRVVELERWRVGRALLHRPARDLAAACDPSGFSSLEVPDCLPRVQLPDRHATFVATDDVVDEVRACWGVLIHPDLPGSRHLRAVVSDPETRKPERWFFGYIRHPRRRGADAAAWAILFLLRWRPWTSPGMWSVVNPKSRFRRWPWPWGWVPFLIDRGPRRILWRVGRSRDVAYSWLWAVFNRARGYQIVRAGQLFDVSAMPFRLVCPECRGRLEAEIQDWYRDGTWEPGGLTVGCVEDDPVAMDGGHRCWQSDWQPVIDDVERWAKRNVRVYSGGWPAEREEFKR